MYGKYPRNDVSSIKSLYGYNGKLLATKSFKRFFSIQCFYYILKQKSILKKKILIYLFDNSILELYYQKIRSRFRYQAEARCTGCFRCGPEDYESTRPSHSSIF